MLRLIKGFAGIGALLACVVGSHSGVFGQGGTASPSPSPTPSQKITAPTPDKKAAAGAPLTAEQVAEATIVFYGSRPVLDQIRRNGIERGRITRVAADGRTEELSYERRFARGADASKDKIRLDQKMPTMEYSLVYGDGRMWGIINGASFAPRKDVAAGFFAQQWHSIDALLRYKENGSTISYVGKEQKKGLDFYVLDLIDKEKRSTRYYISAKSLHVLWLEYEEAPEPNATPIKYTRTFHDYRFPQSTWLPYRSVLLADGKQVQETRILSVTYGLKLEDSIFQNPDAQATNP